MRVLVAFIALVISTNAPAQEQAGKRPEPPPMLRVGGIGNTNIVIAGPTNVRTELDRKCEDNIGIAPLFDQRTRQVPVVIR